MREIKSSVISQISGGTSRIESNIKITVVDDGRFILNDLIFYPDAVCTKRKCILDVFNTEITASLGFSMNGKSEITILANAIEGGATYSIY